MSTRTRTTPLTDDLVDDAAVFPPGLASVEAAWADYLARRTTRYAVSVGPLLIATSSVAELADVAGRHRADQPAVPVALIARPGTSIDQTNRAVAQFEGLHSDSLDLCGVEVAYQDGWQRMLDLDLPLTVEVPVQAGPQQHALAEIAGTAARAKLRTQSTPDQGVPTPTAVARFIATCVVSGIAFKLTGGLHRAIAHTSKPPDVIEERHGVLNVMLATARAVRREPRDVLESSLRQRDPATLVAAVVALPEDDVTAMRNSLTSFGCCGVLDPLRELEELGVLHLLEQETT
ncbi:MAG: hypothetical protein WBG36_09475 [Ornithinimicrobium sp.]